MRVVDTVAVRADDTDAFFSGDALEFTLAFLAAGIETFGIAGGADDHRFHAGAGAVADGLDGGLGGDGEERRWIVDRFPGRDSGQGSAKQGMPVDVRFNAPADAGRCRPGTRCRARLVSTM